MVSVYKAMFSASGVSTAILRLFGASLSAGHLDQIPLRCVRRVTDVGIYLLILFTNQLFLSLRLAVLILARQI